jgi:hypothetical protein
LDNLNEPQWFAFQPSKQTKQQPKILSIQKKCKIDMRKSFARSCFVNQICSQQTKPSPRENSVSNCQTYPAWKAFQAFQNGFSLCAFSQKKRTSSTSLTFGVGLLEQKRQSGTRSGLVSFFGAMGTCCLFRTQCFASEFSIEQQMPLVAVCLGAYERPTNVLWL